MAWTTAKIAISVTVHLASHGRRDRPANSIIALPSHGPDKIAAVPTVEACTVMVKSFVRFGCFNMTYWHIVSCTSSKDCVCAGCYSHSLPFSRRLLMGATFLAYSCTNFARQLNHPKTRSKSFMLVCWRISFILLEKLGSLAIPSEVMMNPKNLVSEDRNSHFFKLPSSLPFLTFPAHNPEAAGPAWYKHISSAYTAFSLGGHSSWPSGELLLIVRRYFYTQRA